MIETCEDSAAYLSPIHNWMVYKRAPVPENSAEMVEQAKVKIMKGLAYIQSVSESRNKKFLISDQVMCIKFIVMYCF